MNLPLIFGLAYIVSACSNAKTADEVDAAVVPTGEYEQMSCEELRTENRKAEQDLADKTAATNEAYRDDKTTEVVTWGLFLPAAFFMDGNSEEQKEQGEAQGRVIAIQDEIDSKCFSSDTNETT